MNGKTVSWWILFLECRFQVCYINCLEYYHDSIIEYYYPGEVDAQWTFNPESDLTEWVVTSDQDNNEGHSSCTLTISPTGKGLFSGNLSTQLVKDGKVKRAGYCNMKSIPPARSFKRETYYDWSSYTHLVLKVRGDGRSYMLNIGSAGYFDITWNDMYNYMLFTRGGPHWQISRVSKNQLTCHYLNGV